jgi:hypothetical protein
MEAGLCCVDMVAEARLQGRGCALAAARLWDTCHLEAGLHGSDWCKLSSALQTKSGAGEQRLQISVPTTIAMVYMMASTHHKPEAATATSTR